MIESYMIENLSKYSNDKVEYKLHSKPYTAIWVTLLFAVVAFFLKLIWISVIAVIVSIIGMVTLKDQILMRFYKDDIVITQDKQYLAIPKKDIKRWKLMSSVANEVLMIELQDEELPLVKVSFVTGSSIRETMRKVLPELENENGI